MTVIGLNSEMNFFAKRDDLKLTTLCMLLAGGSTMLLKKLWASTICWTLSPVSGIGVPVWPSTATPPSINSSWPRSNNLVKHNSNLKLLTKWYDWKIDMTRDNCYRFYYLAIHLWLSTLLAYQTVLWCHSENYRLSFESDSLWTSYLYHGYGFSLKC